MSQNRREKMSEIRESKCPKLGGANVPKCGGASVTHPHQPLKLNHSSILYKTEEEGISQLLCWSQLSTNGCHHHQNLVCLPSCLAWEILNADANVFQFWICGHNAKIFSASPAVQHERAPRSLTKRPTYIPASSGWAHLTKHIWCMMYDVWWGIGVSPFDKSHLQFNNQLLKWSFPPKAGLVELPLPTPPSATSAILLLLLPTSGSLSSFPPFLLLPSLNCFRAVSHVYWYMAVDWPPSA